MKNNNLVTVRSNCNFSLNYENSHLSPQAEIILITTAPKYVVNKKKDTLDKEFDVSEYRFISGIDGINKLIGELQLVAKNITEFHQLSSSFNAIVDAHKERQKQNV